MAAAAARRLAVVAEGTRIDAMAAQSLAAAAQSLAAAAQAVAAVAAVADFG